jgi:hypothetical protein
MSEDERRDSDCRHRDATHRVIGDTKNRYCPSCARHCAQRRHGLRPLTVEQRANAHAVPHGTRNYKFQGRRDAQVAAEFKFQNRTDHEFIELPDGIGVQTAKFAAVDCERSRLFW